MLSRRSVRVKVMQVLFALASDEELTFTQANKSYWNSVNKSFELLLFNLHVIMQISKIAVEDKEKRESKHLPNDFDKNFTAKLYLNPLMQSLFDNLQLKKKFEKMGFYGKVDKDYFRKLYKEFSSQKEYKKYVTNPDGNHLTILLELYRFCRANDFFNEIMEDNFYNWKDDKSLIIGSFKKVLKSLPNGNPLFFEDYYPDDETIKEYGEILLKRTFEEDKMLLEIIKPLLKNWDHERLALIDMILIKMAILELIEFKTIPTKVTINEYVEVSKAYSTPKSKDFINGILDKVLKELSDAGKIVKEGRGLID